MDRLVLHMQPGLVAHRIGINMPIPVGQGENFQAELQAAIQELNAKGHHDLAVQLRAYALQMHAKHPELTFQQIVQAFVASDVSGALGTAIGQTGTILGQTPVAAAKGAQNAFESLGGFNLSSWFLRIGEILLGLVLVGVGVARITGAQNAISKVVKTRLPI